MNGTNNDSRSFAEKNERAAIIFVSFRSPKRSIEHALREIYSLAHNSEWVGRTIRCYFDAYPTRHRLGTESDMKLDLWVTQRARDVFNTFSINITSCWIWARNSLVEWRFKFSACCFSNLMQSDAHNVKHFDLIWYINQLVVTLELERTNSTWLGSNLSQQTTRNHKTCHMTNRKSQTSSRTFIRHKFTSRSLEVHHSINDWIN